MTLPSNYTIETVHGPGCAGCDDAANAAIGLARCTGASKMTSGSNDFGGYHSATVTRELVFPPCSICGEPLTENERDFESGTFSSSHSRCYSTDPDGRFVVIGVGSHSARQDVNRRRYVHRLAAVHEANYLAAANTPYNGTRFFVLDLVENVIVHVGEFDVVRNGEIVRVSGAAS